MEVSVAEARNEFTKLIKRAGEERIIVTRRGEPTVVLVPYEEYERLSRIQAYLELAALAEELRGSGLRATQLYESSRKELEARPGL